MRTAAEGGDAEAQFDLWWFLEDKEEGIKLLIAAVQQGHVYAQSTLGNCFRNGLVVEKDLEEAARWYRAAYSFCQGDFFGRGSVRAVVRRPRRAGFPFGISSSTSFSWSLS